MVYGLRVGKQAVCVDTRPRKPPYLSLARYGLYKGSVYTITAIMWEEAWGLGWGVRVAEAKTPPENGFHADRFRPVRETNTEIKTKEKEKLNEPCN
jgi:hypothetical protein